MSVFLIYFEKNNPNASWAEFQKKRASIVDTFSKVNDVGSLLRIESVQILLDNKTIEAFIIHDGVSSDRILQANLKNDPIVSKQRIVILDFLKNRLTTNILDHYFIFHLYQNSINVVEKIEYDSVVEARLSDLKDFANTVKRNLLYKVIENEGFHVD
jgi:hypothetical protein